MSNPKVAWLWALLFASLLALGLLALREGDAASGEVRLALLVPNEVPLESVPVAVWRAAANEVGIQLQAVHVRHWVRDFSRNQVAEEGVILPDTFHRRLGAGTKEALKQYVESGGRMMVVFDAGTLDETGRFRDAGAILSDLVGVRYAMYASLREKLVQLGAVIGSSETLERLGVPPGRYEAKADRTATELPLLSASWRRAMEQVVSYANGRQALPSHVTEGQPNGVVLLRNTLGHVVASRHHKGKGETLFVNLPLTYLKLRTDGAFLHGFLRYFAVDMLLLPRLAETPEGLGVPILNWHVDAKPAWLSMKQLSQLGVFATEGPFSFHITAGPDVDKPGDGGGLDLDHNAEVREIFQGLFRRGHAIASHGGWIHNDFGKHASDTNQEAMLPLLEKNWQSIVGLTGVAPKEYSAPMGNQPDWVTRWLVSKGIGAMYLTGNLGMGPTRLWSLEGRVASIWTFPVLTMGTVATAEDAFFQKVSQQAFDDWLQDVARFLEREGAMRLIYFHPPGAMLYPVAVMKFVDRIGECRKALRCRWMTLSQAASFMDRREKTVWAVQKEADHWTLNAASLQGLDELTWRFPQARFARPLLVKGVANIRTLGDDWLLVAGPGNELLVDLQEAL